jgi:hypothetical protein
MLCCQALSVDLLPQFVPFASLIYAHYLSGGDGPPRVLAPIPASHALTCQLLRLQ